MNPIQGPMPRFINESVGVASWVLQAKTKASGASGEPLESAMLLKCFGQRFTVPVVSQVQRKSSVVLAMSRGGVFSEDFNQLLSSVELPSNDLLLPAGASKTRNCDQIDPVVLCCGLHSHPCFGSGTREIKVTVIEVESRMNDFCILQENRPLTTDGAVLCDA